MFLALHLAETAHDIEQPALAERWLPLGFFDVPAFARILAHPTSKCM
jgi:hypothetical protein